MLGLKNDSFMKKIMMALLGLASIIYLLNPTAGIFEILPDNIPFLGNIDEASVTLLLLWVLRYFGIDPTQWFQPEKKKPTFDEIIDQE